MTLRGIVQGVRLFLAAALVAGGLCSSLYAEEPAKADAASQSTRNAPWFRSISYGDAAVTAATKPRARLVITGAGRLTAKAPGAAEATHTLADDELAKLRQLAADVAWRSVAKSYARQAGGDAQQRLFGDAQQHLSVAIGAQVYGTTIGGAESSQAVPEPLGLLLKFLEDLRERYGSTQAAGNQSGEKTAQRPDAGAGQPSSGGTGPAGAYSSGSSGQSSGGGGRSGRGVVGGGTGGRPSQPLSVLFIGNSYTAANDLPHLVAGLAEATRGRPIEVASVTPGGCTLEQHVATSGAMAKIRDRRWDVVVLQEQSLYPLVRRDNMYAAARTLVAEINKQGARTVFFLTWARRDKPETQKGLNEAYFGIAKQLGAEVAPVGVAWQKALAADPTLVLHQADGSHPNQRGSYLAACVFYAVLLGQSPEGLPAEVQSGGKTLLRLPQGEAQRLQTIAAEAVRPAD